MDSCVEHQRVNVGEQAVEKVVAELVTVSRVECPASIKVTERGWQDPQLHRSIF
jgi:hypothetical protein